jgi:hypothetical protein
MKLAFASLKTIAIPRLAIGLAQGAALYLLARAFQAKTWPATDLAIYDALLMTARSWPVFAIISIGNLRGRTAVVWLAAIAILCAGLGFYAGFRDPAPPLNFSLGAAALLNTLFGLSLLLFIGHSLVAAADADGRIIARFPTYFDVAWRLGTQFTLATVFVLLFLGIVWLGATLFNAIGIDFFLKTIAKIWFSIPVTAMATSAALHLTDARTGLIRGARSLVLTLLSWLLPVMTLIGLGFLGTLPFTGLEALWKTRYATGSLLAAAAILILLVNSHFQDGGPETNKVRFLTWTRLLATLLPTPLVALASWGLWLRVAQYGWSPSRVIAAAIVVVVACHALGYAFAALSSGTVLRALPATNIVSAFVTIVVVLALMTPIADPARVAVASQVARLESATISPDKFDYNFLRLRSARFGREALERLKATRDGPNAAEIAARAAVNLATLSPTAAAIVNGTQPRATAQTRAANIKMLRENSSALPPSFLQQDWNSSKDRAKLQPCLLLATAAKCEAILLDLTGDGTPDIILLGSGAASAGVFTADSRGEWSFIGNLGNLFCPGVRDALRAGNFEAISPTFKSIQANGVRLQIMPDCTAQKP